MMMGQSGLSSRNEERRARLSEPATGNVARLYWRIVGSSLAVIMAVLTLSYNISVM